MTTEPQPNGQANGHFNAPPEPIEAEEDGGKISKLQYSEVIRMTQLLSEHATIDPVTKTVIYKDGWSDERICEELRKQPGREHLKERSITDLRREEIGLLPSEREREIERTAKAASRNNPSKAERGLRGQLSSALKINEELLKRVKRLEDRVANLEARDA